MAWPKGVKRGPRPTAINPPLQTPNQIPVVEMVNEPLREGAIQARGRDGEVLTRKRTMSSDIFQIPQSIIPQGWTYQWNPYEVLGKPFSAVEGSMALSMHENGWRPVPAGRHPGRFMPQGTSPTSHIVRDGLILEERPEELTNEAKREEAAKAGQLVKDQQEQLGLTQKLPTGFSRDNVQLQRAERSRTSRTIAPANDIPRPALPIDPNV